jgi:hypothetical protein
MPTGKDQMEESPKPRTGKLAKKLAKIQAEVSAISKSGHNDEFDYAYATDSDIYNAVREKLAKAHVTLTPAITAVERKDYRTGDGGVSTLTTISMEMLWEDGETGEQLVRPWASEGEDPGDKAIRKALTNGAKAFLLISFLIPSGNDAEADAAADKRTRSRKAPPAQTSASSGSTQRPPQGSTQRRSGQAGGGQRLANMRQVAMVKERAEEMGLDDHALGVVLKAATGNEDIAKLPARLVDAVLAKIKEAAEA